VPTVATRRRVDERRPRPVDGRRDPVAAGGAAHVGRVDRLCGIVGNGVERGAQTHVARTQGVERRGV
jgi:hypothetical protein